MKQRNIDTRSIGEMLNQWQHGIVMDESDVARYEIIVMFDHDYEFHMLLVEWAKEEGSHIFLRTGYTLWFLGVNNPPVKVRSWPADRKPIAAAAAIVQDWNDMIASKE